MRVETLSCPTCGTVVAANVLESYRVLKCPRVKCETVLRFDDLSEDVREHYTDNAERYRIG